MKNTHNFENVENLEDDLLPEYNIDYRKARANRFVIQQAEESITVKIEPDVAKVFKTSEEVNQALRAILAAIPK